MRMLHLISTPVAGGLFLAVVLTSSVAWIAHADDHAAAPTVDATSPKLEATIFSFDGQDFVRTRTTLRNAQGKSAESTKLDRNTDAFRALVARRSWSGEAAVFGRAYDANYAPLTDANGRVTGALFVAIAKPMKPTLTQRGTKKP